MRRLLRFVVAWCALLLLKSPVRESHMFIPSGYNSFAFGPIRSQVQLKPASQQASPGIGRSENVMKFKQPSARCLPIARHEHNVALLVWRRQPGNQTRC
jgi:hypothetical protein